MFRRRMDFSWPLLLILFCVFVLSINLPRGWERIARPTALVEAPKVPAGPQPTPIASEPNLFEGFRQAEIQPRIAAEVAMEPKRPDPVAEPAPEVLVEQVPAEGPMAAPEDVSVSPESQRVAVLSPPEDRPQGDLPEPDLEPSLVAIAQRNAAAAPQASVPTEPPSAEPPAEEKVIPLPVSPEPLAVASAEPARLPAEPEDASGAAQAPAAYPNTGAPPVKTFVPEPAQADPQDLATLNLSKTPAEPPCGKGAPSDSPKAVAPEIAWREPETLLAELKAMAERPATAAWSTEALGLLKRLGPAMSSTSPETASILDRLDQLCDESPKMIAMLRDRAQIEAFSRTAHGLERRVSIWKQIERTGGFAAAQATAPAIDPESLANCVSQIDSLTEGSEEGKAWRKYLLLDSLREWVARRKPAEDRLPRELAQGLMQRFNHGHMTPHQRQFLTSEPIVALQREVIRHTAGPVDARRLLVHLERYEQTGLSSDARLLAEDCRNLALASSSSLRDLGQQLDTHYRNANIRLAVTEDLMNRLIPERPAEYAEVRDSVLGIPVRGQSLMASELAVRLLPDPSKVRIALEVTGEVASLTSSTSGPATFITESESIYIAKKPMEVNLQGITLWPTEVEVDNKSRLRGIKTSVDRAPLLGSVVRIAAQRGHDEKKPAVDAEVRRKIAAQATERVDRETNDQIRQAARNLHQNVLGPMESLLLDPTLIDAETTEQRFVMRVRLAGRDQLGSHTPRPQAPADSLASVQIHETALNNVIDRLELEGKTFTLPELGEHIARRLNRPMKPCDPDQEDVKITFAGCDPIRVRCVDGRLEVNLAIAKLSKSPRKWKDFQVRAYYRPEIRGRSVVLVRDGVVQLIGRLSTGSQLALRGVFSRVFSQKTPWNVTPEQFVNNPKLDGLAFTQFVINEGWIGVALGPQRTAARPAVLRR